MRVKTPIFLLLALLAAAVPGAGQEPGAPTGTPALAPLFVRMTAYPTASLSRYDYNNDVDLFEIRLYVEIRLGSLEGAAIADARVTALSERLDFHQDHYEKRVLLDKDKLPAEIDAEISLAGRPVIMERFPVPAWLVLTEPRPAVIEAGRDLAVRWRFSRFPSPVDLRAYDFRTGKEIFRRDHMEETEAVVPAAGLPASTIVRVYAVQSWLYKRFLAGEGYARGSEINVIPWSQVFVRTQ